MTAKAIDWSSPKTRNFMSFGIMVMFFAVAGFLQVRANRGPASEEEIAEVAGLGQCETHMLKAREEAATQTPLSKVELQQIQAACERQEALKANKKP